MKACEGYTYALAISDIAPIVVFATAFWLLSTGLRFPAPIVRHGVNLAAVLLVVGSAVAGPIRKTLMAAETGDVCNNLHAMQLPFFTAMSFAFALLAWATFSVLRRQVMPVVWWLAPVPLIWASALFVGEDVILLAGGGIYAVIWAGLLSRLSVREGVPAAAVLFVLYAVGTLGLPVLAAGEERTDSANQWLEQGVNTLNMVLLAAGSYLLRGALRRSGDRSVLVEK